MLSDKAKGDLLARSANHDRHLAIDRTRIELAETLLNDGEGSGEIAQAVRSGFTVVAIFDIVALEPAGADAKQKRPPEMWSMVRDISARRFGFRSESPGDRAPI